MRDSFEQFKAGLMQSLKLDLEARQRRQGRTLAAARGEPVVPKVTAIPVLYENRVFSTMSRYSGVTSSEASYVGTASSAASYFRTNGYTSVEPEEPEVTLEQLRVMASKLGVKVVSTEETLARLAADMAGEPPSDTTQSVIVSRVKTPRKFEGA